MTDSFGPASERRIAANERQRVSQKALDDEYRAVLKEIKSEFKGERDAERFFEDKYQDKTFLRRQFFRERFLDPSTTTATKEKVALIAAWRGANTISSLVMKMLTGQLGPFTYQTHYDGFYRYWRHYPTHSEVNPVRWGVIRLQTDQHNGTIIKHWSADYVIKNELKDNYPIDWQKFRQPSDQGHAFFVHGRMYALSFRRGNIRSIILNFPEEAENVKSETLNGLMLTSRKVGGAIFAAGLLVVHCDNSLARSALSLKTFTDWIRIIVSADKTMLHE